MRKIIVVVIFFSVFSFIAWGGVFYWKNLRGVGPVLKDPPEDITKVIPAASPDAPQNSTEYPLKLPAGFFISIFAKDLPGARVMTFDKEGDMWVSQTGQGTISHLIIKNGIVAKKHTPLAGLRKPHGLTFGREFPDILYFAEENKISYVAITSAALPVKIADLPSGGGHFTRTLGFGPDNRLYVSVGSSCNVCNEKDSRRASIFSMKRGGGDFKEFAKGLRNAVFFTWNPRDQKMWATEMGRDYLGDNTPPDEINIIEDGKNYGWPTCYGKNIHDTDFDKNTYIRNPCEEPFESPSYIDLQAHSAPLGLAFVPPNSQWPEEYWYNLFVVVHGSWNRSVPTGYKVIRIKLDMHGRYFGTEDFITGWLTQKGALGRPVDIIIRPDGIMFISDDKAGVIYRVTHKTVK